MKRLFFYKFIEYRLKTYVHADYILATDLTVARTTRYIVTYKVNLVNLGGP